jgi:putative phage-type endonuclease
MPPTLAPNPFRVILPAAADREEWLTVRRTGIGSSDVPAIVGATRYRTPLHVYHDKRGTLALDEDPGEAALWGNLHEETVAREWARRNRTVVRRVGIAARRDEPWMMCTLDRRCTECPLDHDRRERCAVEVKTRTAWAAGSWRRDVPDDVLAQTLWQIAVTGYDHIHVACLIGGNDYRQYTVRRAGNEDLIADIITIARRLWDDIQAGREPAMSGGEDPDALVDLYGRLYPDRAGFVDLDVDPAVSVAVLEDLRAYEENRLLEGRYRRAKDAARAALVGRLDDAEAALMNNEPAFSYDTSSRRTVDLARLAEEFPEAYEACVVDKPSRRLNIARSYRLTLEDINVPA